MIPKPIETIPPKGPVLVWRDDQKTWEIADFPRHYIGLSELAYTYWLPLPPNPEE